MTDTLPGARAGALASAPLPLHAPAPTHNRAAREAASIAGLQALAQQLGRTALDAADVQAADGARRRSGDKCLSPDVLRRRFGSLGEALEAAGLTLARTTPLHSNLDCFANMEAVWRHHGRPPRIADITRPPSTVGRAAYLSRAGTWRAAVEAFAAFTGADPHRPGPPGKVGVGMANGPRTTRHEPASPSARADRRTRALDLRPAPLALRFQVLQRDRFRCTACGNSPARDADCALQVDHILPRSKGGRSTLDNLRCLCAPCNLGRGNRDAGGR